LLFFTLIVVLQIAVLQIVVFQIVVLHIVVLQIVALQILVFLIVVLLCVVVVASIGDGAGKIQCGEMTERGKGSQEKSCLHWFCP
jgi:hypothetical protein